MSDFVGYKFIPYSRKRKKYLNKSFSVYNSDISKATDVFIRKLFRLGENSSVVHLNIRTVDLEENICGRNALVCDQKLQVISKGRKTRFKIEKIIVGDSNDRRK